jgi:enolase
MSVIEAVHGRAILDSRGRPTVEADVVLTSGAMGRAAVPSGASTGEGEAVELRDGGEAWGGAGVTRAVGNLVGEIADLLRGVEAADQRRIDRLMIAEDGTPNKSRLGANAILAASLAVAKAVAAEHREPLWRYLQEGQPATLPVPFMNLLNGGAHADNGVDFQEFMIVPWGFPTFSEALRAGAEVYAALKARLTAMGLPTVVGDEGGFAPHLASERDALELLLTAIEDAGYRPHDQIALAIDPAMSALFDGGAYVLANYGHTFTPNELASFWEGLAAEYPIVMLEDPMSEDDWGGWQAVSERLRTRIELVGDDVFVTNRRLLERGIELEVANAILIKPNQIGTLSETLDTAEAARDAGYRVVVSHRSGETEDVTIADLAVALGCGQIKTGAPCRSERVAKYNRLLHIEEELGPKAVFSGRRVMERTL